MTELEGTAFHEAGHAVLMVVYGIRFKHVTITESDDALGHVLSDNPPWFDPQYGLSQYTEHYTRARIYSLYAGQLAQQLFTGDANLAGAESDNNRIGELAGFVSGSNEDASDMLSQLRQETEEHIAAFNYHIIAVAKALLEQQTLAEEKVVEIMSRVPNEPDPFDPEWAEYTQRS